MFGDIGVPELLIILVIVMLLFGAGRVGRHGKDLGTAVKDFRSAVKDDEAPADGQQSLPANQAATLPQPPAQAPAPQPPQQPTQNQGPRPPAVF